MSDLETGFRHGPKGNLYISLFSPARAVSSSKWVIHVPAFGEEMNKSRAMVAQQARALAALGLTVLVPDPFGTGDSAGNLEDTSWQVWRDDIAFLSAWARDQGAQHVTFWGLRMGCLLAADVAQSLDRPPEKLLFWQPVHSGRQHMVQFLRLRMAAGLSTDDTETVTQLSERLRQGQSVEVAGYTLPGALFNEIDLVDLSQVLIPSTTQVRILEIVSEAQKPVMRISAELINQWALAGINCEGETALGSPFWMTQELAFSPDLIKKTTEQMMQVAAAGVGSSGYSVPRSDQWKLSVNTLHPKPQSSEQGVVFNCKGEQLSGILHHAPGDSTLGVLIVVGGPQYRVGSHRQFVRLARRLAEAGIPVLRFDYRGMGDSSGELQGFEHVNCDIRSAIDFFQHENSQVTRVAIWGLCDAATAAVFYAAGDTRIVALMLANPWVYSEKGAAKALLKHYYLQRLFEPEFWGKVRSGNFTFYSSISSMWSMLKGWLAIQPLKKAGLALREPGNGASESPQDSEDTELPLDLVNRVSEMLEKFSGNVLIILSGSDLTAAEFVDSTRSNSKLRRAIKRSNVSQFTLSKADHTFSREMWSREVEERSLSFFKGLPSE